MKDKTHLRILKVDPNEKRHKLVYQFADGRELAIWFVANIRAPWQPPYFLYIHSAWLSEQGGTKLLGGVVHNPAAQGPSEECYFFGSDSLTQRELHAYLQAASRRVMRTWGRHKDFVWIARESTVGVWRTLVERLAAENIPVIAEELAASAVPRIA